MEKKDDAITFVLVEVLRDCEMQLSRYHRESIGNDAVGECACAASSAILRARAILAEVDRSRILPKK